MVTDVPSPGNAGELLDTWIVMIAVSFGRCMNWSLLLLLGMAGAWVDFSEMLGRSNCIMVQLCWEGG